VQNLAFWFAPQKNILNAHWYFQFKQSSKNISVLRPSMSKHVDFGASATLIQAWYRQRSTRKLLRIAQARFDSLERSICSEIQAIFPCYQYSNSQDFLQRFVLFMVSSHVPFCNWIFIHTLQQPTLALIHHDKPRLRTHDCTSGAHTGREQRRKQHNRIKTRYFERSTNTSQRSACCRSNLHPQSRQEYFGKATQ